MSTSRAPSARNWVAVTGVPLIHPRLLPCASMVRRNSSSPSSPGSTPSSSSMARTESVVSKTALMSALDAPSRTTWVSARAPMASCSASSRMDLPAPVSPVSTLKPSCSARSSDWTSTKSRRMMRLRATVRRSPCSSAVFPAGYRNNSSSAGAGNVRIARIAGFERTDLAATEHSGSGRQNWQSHRVD